MSTCTTGCPLADAYVEYEHDLERVVRIFQRRHKGDFEDLLSEARIHFIRAYRAFDFNGPKQKRSNFFSVIWGAVWWGLLSYKRRQMKAKHLFTSSMRPLSSLARTPKSMIRHTAFDLCSLISDLGDDARTIMTMAAGADSRVSGKPSRAKIRRALESMGWDDHRMRAAWQKAAEAI